MTLAILAVMMCLSGCVMENSKTSPYCLPLVKYTRTQQNDALDWIKENPQQIISMMIIDYGKLRNQARAICKN